MAPSPNHQNQDGSAISIEGVSKQFSLGAASANTLKERLLQRNRQEATTFDALTHISFTIAHGETFGILGHNGSGKSTLLKLIAGIMQPTEGTIRVEGRLAALLELGAGFHPELSGRENIFLNGSILNLGHNYVESVYDEIVDFAELEDFIDMPVKSYSSGMRARLGFSVATHLQPDVLLVDEVLAVGDENFQRKCMNRVESFRSSGRTMVLVSHSASRVTQLCRRAAVIDRGELLFVGPSEESVQLYRDTMAKRQGHRSGTTNLPNALKNRSPRDDDAPPPPVQVVDASLDDPLPDEVTYRPGQDVKLWVEVEVDDPIDFRLRLALRNQEGFALVNRSSNSLRPEGLNLGAGRHRIAFTFEAIPLQSGVFHLVAFTESPDGSERYGDPVPVGDLRVDGGIKGVGPLLVTMTMSLDHESTGPARSPRSAPAADPGSTSLATATT